MKTVFRILIIMSLLYAGMCYYTRVTEKNIDDALPAEAGRVLRNGTFVGKDSVHEGRGKVSEHVLGEEKLLRFEEFYVTNGIDLRVMLSEDGSVSSSTIKLARLKGNSGNQNYDIPKEVNTEVLDTVIIYSRIFKTIFSTATLH